MLQGLLPTETFTREQLDRTLLEGRFCEIRMLYYVGKDLVRWIEQCLEIVQREELLRKAEVEFHSFVALLIGEVGSFRLQSHLLPRRGPQYDFCRGAG
jgi:hypothetical protein